MTSDREEPVATGSSADRVRPEAVRSSQVDPGSRASTDSAGHVQDRESQPPAGQATGAGGGHGVGSDRSAGGSGEPDAAGSGQPTSADDQTEWLRNASGGPGEEPL